MRSESWDRNEAGVHNGVSFKNLIEREVLYFLQIIEGAHYIHLDGLLDLLLYL